MAQNIIVKGKDNPVNIVFSFTGEFEQNGLNEFSSIELSIGGETYSTGTPNLIIKSSTELSLRVGDVTTLGDGIYRPEIVGYSATFDDGFLLSGSCNPQLGFIEVC